MADQGRRDDEVTPDARVIGACGGCGRLHVQEADGHHTMLKRIDEGESRSADDEVVTIGRGDKPGHVKLIRVNRGPARANSRQFVNGWARTFGDKSAPN